MDDWVTKLNRMPQRISFYRVCFRSIPVWPMDVVMMMNWPQGYKTFSILNSIEHEILNAHKCKNIEKFSFFHAQISVECYFSCS